jgi:hypothetical protein
MQDSKDSSWRDNYDIDADCSETLPEKEAELRGPDTDSQDGWQQYRRWISKAPAPRGRRSNLDPALYTWKGYRNWTEQVKRNWSDS